MALMLGALVTAHGGFKLRLNLKTVRGGKQGERAFITYPFQQSSRGEAASKSLLLKSVQISSCECLGC